MTGFKVPGPSHPKTYCFRALQLSFWGKRRDDLPQCLQKALAYFSPQILSVINNEGNGGYVSQSMRSGDGPGCCGDGGDVSS